ITQIKRHAEQYDHDNRQHRHQYAVGQHPPLLDRAEYRVGHSRPALPRTSFATRMSSSIASTIAGPPQVHRRVGITTKRVRSAIRAITGCLSTSVAIAGGPSRFALTIKTSTFSDTIVSSGIWP